MKKSTIYFKKSLKLNNPVMVVGLPGIGSVGSIVAEYLKSELGAKKFATLYSPTFPHQAIMLPNGRFRFLSNRFYYVKNVNNKKGKEQRDLILLVGDTQPLTTEGQYDVNEKIIRFFKMLGGTTIYTIAGYNTTETQTGAPRVFGVATDGKTIAELKQKKVIFGKATGMIYGASGMLIGFAKMHGIKGACIMGETAMIDYFDANSAKAVLSILKDILSIDISLDNIDKLRKETQNLLKELEDVAKAQNAQQSQERPTYIR
jgi:uncharacterized protein (TIGR00162 family)